MPNIVLIMTDQMKATSSSLFWSGGWPGDGRNGVSWPWTIGEGIRIESPINRVDILPTLLHLQGVPTPDWMQGRLLPGITDSPGAGSTFSEYGARRRRFTLDDSPLPVVA